MPIHAAIWKVGSQSQPLTRELIGQSKAGEIDLLTIARDRALVLIELKRDRTPREVVAQALERGRLNKVL